MEQAIEGIIGRVRTAFREGDPDVERKTLEAENVRCIEDQYRAIVRGDFEAVQELMTEDVDMEIVGPPGMPMTGRWHGRSEVGEALRQNFGQIREQQPEIQTVTAQGDTVVITGRDTGIFQPTGRPFILHWVQLFTLRDGKVARVREILDSASLMGTVQPAAEPA